MSGELSFEKAMERLEEIVNQLENGNLSLDEAIEIYNEGVKLSLYCDAKLNEAEGKIMKISFENNTFKEIEINKDEKE